ncbi:MAG: hypothetical protein KC978_19225, partial [Candidatus Omnitrophica bacterium]|nr:hypothetical protein [Candidatus Omnitrophota bacterium]
SVPKTMRNLCANISILHHNHSMPKTLPPSPSPENNRSASHREVGCRHYYDCQPIDLKYLPVQGRCMPPGIEAVRHVADTVP